MAHTKRRLCTPPSYSFIQIQSRHKACQRVFNGNRPGNDSPNVEEYQVVQEIQSFINASKLSILIRRQINPVPHRFILHLNIIPPSTFKLWIVSSLRMECCKQITHKYGNVNVSFVFLSLQGGGNILSVITWQLPLSATVLSQSFYWMIIQSVAEVTDRSCATLYKLFLLSPLLYHQSITDYKYT